MHAKFRNNKKNTIKNKVEPGENLGHGYGFHYIGVSTMKSPSVATFYTFIPHFCGFECSEYGALAQGGGPKQGTLIKQRGYH